MDEQKLPAPDCRFVVTDESMDDCTTNCVPKGWTVTVDPNKKPRSKSLVIATNMDGTLATFRQLVYVGRRRLLRALNPNSNTNMIDMKQAKLKVWGVAVSSRPPSINLLPDNHEPA